ncbi:MAG: phytoene/squalene synthase family protein [Demequina sp.]
MTHYDQAAQAAAAQVISHYSTSFGVGTRLLAVPMRRHIESIYALVRVADELVDTYRGKDARTLLDALEAETDEALERGFSANIVVHAFSSTARDVGITREQTSPFFAAMRMDLDTSTHDADSFETYVHGSAAVIGEMCLAVFLNTGHGPRPLPQDLAAGARALGIAYQKINFLRDLGMDDGQLGRSYFPGVDAQSLTDAQLAELVASARDDITAAQQCLPGLPRRARIAVQTTIDIYSRLLTEIARTPAAELVSRRVRVGNGTKLVLAVRNAFPWPATTHRSVA